MYSCKICILALGYNLHSNKITATLTHSPGAFTLVCNYAGEYIVQLTFSFDFLSLMSVFRIDSTM